MEPTSSHDEKPRVLIIDDDTLYLQIMTDALQDTCDVTVAKDHEQGWELATQKPFPDIILLDVVMPKISGHDLCRKLKKHPLTFKIPVIFISALSNVEDKTKGFDLGAVDYVTKPIEVPVLRARVRNHIMLRLQQEMLEDLSARDALTGLSNKRRYYEAIESEWKRASRADECLGLIVLDIDHFKKYNDSLGHGAGDMCLQKVASVIKQSVVRPGDLVARIGGEEFAVILPNSDIDATNIVANRILENINAAQIPHPQSKTSDYITLSLGIASKKPSLEDSTRDLFHSADDALYKAKRSGRNQIKRAQ